jgi:hypothetical protein
MHDYHHSSYYPTPGLGMGTVESFSLGLFAAGCVSAFQDVDSWKSEGHQKRVLRHALQGGTALAAGTYAAQAVRRGHYTDALIAAVAGAAGVMALESLLRESSQNQHQGQCDE